jgi:small-conductance mechanosensitive channel
VLLLLLLAFQHDVIALVPPLERDPARLGLVLAAGLLGVLAVRETVAIAGRAMHRQPPPLWRNLAIWTLYGLLALWLSSMLGVDLSSLLVGGAIVGVVVATASQSILGNFFGGLVLLFARPYEVGSNVRVRGSALGSAEFEGTVVDVGALYTSLRTPVGDTVRLPNSAVMASSLTLSAPGQVEMDIELPPGTSIQRLCEAVRARVPGGDRVRVTFRPQAVTAEKVVCRVQVRAGSIVDPGDLALAVADALASMREPEVARLR